MTSNHKVAGSSPALGEYARLAQSVERTPFKRVVVGSSPTSGGGKRQTLGLEPEVSTGQETDKKLKKLKKIKKIQIKSINR